MTPTRTHARTTVLSVLHPVSPEVLREWVSDVERSAAVSGGHHGTRLAWVGEHGPGGALDTAYAVTFASEDDADRWLESSTRTDLLADADARGIRRRSAELIVVDGDRAPTGTAMFTHRVAVGRDEEFLATQRELVALSARFPGFDGAALLGPTDADPDEWTSVLRFRTDRQLGAWLESEQRLNALPELRSHLEADFSAVTQNTPFGSILRVEDGRTTLTPNWKTGMMVLLVLYPTVMLLSRFLGPILDEIGVDPWLSMWLSQICSVTLMTYFLMPWATGLFSRWLDPSSGASVKVSVVGALAVVAVYAGTLALFASVQWLQFWDYV